MKNGKKKKYNILENIKKIMQKNRKVLLTVFIIGIAILILSTILGNRLTTLEELALKNNSQKVIIYLDEVENSKSKKVDKYINYALEYNYNENGSNKLSIKQTKKIINSIFNIELTEKQITKIGITPDMLDKRIVYDYDNKAFIIEKNNDTYSDIASRKIYYYDLQKIIKKNNNKYIIRYKKYIISNPYEILNYYEDLNKTAKEKYNTDEIMNYLTGKANSKTLRKYISNGNIKKFGKEKGQVEIEYIIKDDKILINKITAKK